MLCGAPVHVSQDFAPLRGSTINGCQAGTCALLNFQMDHSVLLSLFLAHFLISLCLLPSRVASRVVRLFFVLLFLSVGFVVPSPRLCLQWLSSRASFDRLLLAQSLVKCAPQLSHVASSLRGKDSVAIFQRRNNGD